MASTSFIQSFDPFSRSRRTTRPNSKRNTGLIVRAMREAHNHNSSGRLVDESMIVLRKRIREIKVVEADCDLPSEWMDWEKRVYTNYDSVICDAMGHLQSYLMETRPSFALAMLVLIALSVPTSTAVVIHNLFGFSNLVLSGIHLG